MAPGTLPLISAQSSPKRLGLAVELDSPPSLRLRATMSDHKITTMKIFNSSVNTDIVVFCVYGEPSSANKGSYQKSYSAAMTFRRSRVVRYSVVVSILRFNCLQLQLESLFSWYACSPQPYFLSPGLNFRIVSPDIVFLLSFSSFCPKILTSHLLPSCSQFHLRPAPFLGL